MRAMSNRKVKISLAVKLSLIIMLTSLLGVSAVAYLAISQAKEVFKQKNDSAIQRSLQKYEKNTQDSLKKLKQDVLMLANNNSVKGFIRAFRNRFNYDEVENKTIDIYKKELKELFKIVLKQNKNYFQVRLIDPVSGEELVRVDRKYGKILVVPDSKLQNKLSRDYTQMAIKKRGEFYISKIDLNREFGKIEFPIKPTLRVAKLTSNDLKNSGIIVINVDVSELLEFNKQRRNKIIKTYIANKEGYYLLNTKEPNKEFGFEFDRDYLIYDDFKQFKDFYNSDEVALNIDMQNSILKAKKIFITPKRFIVIAKHTTESLFGKSEQNYFAKLLFFIVLTVIVIFIITVVVARKFTHPIIKLTKVANEIAESRGSKKVRIDVESNDEIGELSSSIKVMLDTLLKSKRELEEFASRLEIEVEKKTHELKVVNEGLQKKVDEKLAELRKKDQVLLQQNKMATIGETIGAIAHQWRQPLNSLALNIQMLVDMAEDKQCSVEEMEEFVDKNMKTIQFMSQTIDDFRNFFREDREASRFDVKEAIEATLALQTNQLKNNHIDLDTNLISIEILGYRSKFMQVVLNLISNAKDAILEKRERDTSFEGKINIVMKKNTDGFVDIEFEDNGKEIPKEIEKKIFEPYFTTKELNKGTGMGLYMASEIIANMDGELMLKNDERKVFIIRLRIK